MNGETDIFAFLAGCVLLGLWIAFLFESRNEMTRRERLSHAFVFQWNVLPLIVAFELFATGSFVVAGVGLLLFFVAWPAARFLSTWLPFIAGWHVGMQLFSHILPGSFERAVAGGVVCAIAMTVLCQLVITMVMRPPRHV